MGPSTTFNRLPSTIPKSEKSKPLVDGLPIFRKCCYGRPLRAKRSRWAAFVAQHQTGHFGTEIFDHICQPIARAAKKARPKLATQAFSRFAKAGKQSVFHRNLGGDVGRHRFPSPRTLMKTALAPNRAKAVKDILWSGRRESNPAGCEAEKMREHFPAQHARANGPQRNKGLRSKPLDFPSPAP